MTKWEGTDRRSDLLAADRREWTGRVTPDTGRPSDAESGSAVGPPTEMIVGHSMLAFAVVAGVGAALGWSHQRALWAGVAAAAFALVPDIDMVWGLVAVTSVEATTPVATLDALWVETSRFHRFATHFLATGVVGTVAFTAVGTALGEEHDWLDVVRFVAGVALLVGLVAALRHRFGPIIASVVAVYGVAGVVVAVVAVRRAGLDSRALLLAAGFGLLSHPFGDMFTGQPPSMFYPLAREFPEYAISFHPDPTLEFLAVFVIELATVWAALLSLRLVTGRPTPSNLDARALLGVPYAVVALVGPVPTPLVAYYPSFSVLATGSLGVLVVRPDRSVRWLATGGRRWPDRSGLLRDATTALAAVTLAVATYACGYLLLAG